MDASEADEDSPFTARDAKLHVEICRKLSANVCKIMEIFPVLEAARPRSKTGIQSLCSVHVALDKAKNLLQHCSNCSKLYLAITGDSILLKFEKVSCALKDCLIQVVDIVPEAIGCQIMEIVRELEETTFILDEVEKQAGDEIIQLLQNEKKFDNGNSTDCEELEIFHQVATQLGIAASSRAALTERRALKKLIERARTEEDKRKESIVAYLLYLMRKYSKFFRSEISDDTDSQCSSPCSPAITPGHGNGHAFERHLSKLSSFNFKPTGLRSGSIPVPPEEFRCPISLQLMYDPVIISSGQTYERACIEKWFNDGHHTCPKTQQHLPHSCLTPNYCVKALIGSWCQQNKLPLPIAPPNSLDLNYWRLALGSERREAILLDSKSMDSKAVPLDKENEEDVMNPDDFEMDDLFVRYEKLLYALYNGKSGKEQLDAVEQIRLLVKDNDEVRAYMGANGFIDGLFLFLRSAIEEGDENSQAVATMALFNLSVNNSRNKGLMLSAGVITLLEEMVRTSTAYEAAVALYLNLSCLNNAKPVIGSSKVVPFLVKLLRVENCKPQCRADALHTLYNISNHAPNINSLLCAGIVNSLHTLITRSSVSEEEEVGWAEKSIAVFINLASNKLGRRDIISTPGLVSDIAKALETDDPPQQEQAISCLLQLCNEDPTCCDMVLQEGVIPALVLVSATGTPRGKDKAQKLLMLFREMRQSESSSEEHKTEISRDNVVATTMEGKCLVKSAPKRTSRSVRRRLAAIWKRKNFSPVPVCW